MPPLPSSSPHPMVRADARPAFRAGWRTLPRLPQTIRRGGSPCAAPSSFGHPLQTILLSCGALAMVVRAPSMAVPFGHGHPGRSRLGSLQHIPSKRPGHRAIPPARITGDTPVIAAASSDDAQQHWRLGHGVRAVSMEYGRIGYWYTNSRFARGAILARASAWFRDLSFLVDLDTNQDGEG